MKQILQTALLPTATMLLGITVGGLSKATTGSEYCVALLLIFTTVAVSSILTAFFIHAPLQRQILEMEKFSQLNWENLKSATATAKGELLSPQRMAALEQSTPFKDVWIMSRNLSNVASGKLFFNVVEANIKHRKSNYIYFIPDAPMLAFKQQQFAEAFKKHPGALRFVNVDPNLWLIPMLTHSIILNPLGKEGKDPEVYFEIPFEQPCGNSEGEWAQVSTDMAIQLVELLKKSLDLPLPTRKIMQK